MPDLKNISSAKLNLDWIGLAKCTLSGVGTLRRAHANLIADQQAIKDAATDACRFRDPAAVMASHCRDDGRSKPAPGTARHRDPVG